MLNKSSVHFTTLSLALSVGLTLYASIPATAESPQTPIRQTTPNRGQIRSGRLRFRLPKVGAPRTREPGASRGSSNCSNQEKSVMALLPNTNVGLTLAERPTLFVAIPSSSAQQAEFTLHDEENQQEALYKTKIPIPSTAGIVSISLPSDADSPQLEVGKKYRWSFSVICDAEDRAADIFVEGWVQRMEPSATLVKDLQKATERDRPVLYAEAGLWLDTIASLADLRNASPNDSSLVTDWEDLLKAVNLGKVAKEPLIKLETNTSSTP
ncbi:MULTISPECIES: DUF928 domain-containing protein [Cyanophyceae]|uniref:DUF928 domain-containing protein n=1 Tax=Cyanophyceae TaxID=3028117 RepID=UPI001687BE7D|nr:DUF928 domain-containing protein [Trichocoleus sp. FACHB-69]MBD1934115.1 DUF928 domain-containing protein [Trichocoleus sp. FACHB-69]